MNLNDVTRGTIAGLLLGCIVVCAPSGNAEPLLPPCCQHAAAASSVAEPNGSISDISAEWETDSGKKLKLSDLNGRVRVISMFFATCQGVCVITRQDMQQIEASLSLATRHNVNFILVTLDPVRDTAADLRSYRRSENLSPRRWTLLRGDDDATAKLAELLGVTAGRDTSGRFIHSSELVVLDPSGRIIHRYSGTQADLSAIAAEIETTVLSSTKRP